MSNFFHLAGIIPVASKPTGFDLPWDDCLIPLAPNFFAIELAVYQAAMAGCETVWVVCPLDTVPLVRKRLGDFTYDPTTIGAKRLSKMPDKYRKIIPIYYVPIPEKEEHKSACIPWSIIKGATVAHSISAGISKWTTPDKFYVSFPYGVFNPKQIREHRKLISSKNNFMLYHNGAVADNKHLSFTFSQLEYKHFYNNFKDHENSVIVPGESSFDHFTEEVDLNLLFKDLVIEDTNYVELDWFHQIDTWDNYRAYLSDDKSNEIHFPGKIFISYHEWNPIAEDLE